MKWLKHYSDMRFDPKIRRLIAKYGIEGYGIYNVVIETIAYQLEPDKPMPDLEENSQDIAEMFKMDTIKVEEIINYCIKEELFVKHPESGRIVCLKMLAHLDNTMSTNPEIRKILDNFSKLKETLSPLKQISLSELSIDNHSISKTKKDRKHRYMEFVTITTPEYFKLKELYGRAGVRDRAGALNLWKGSKGKKTASDYLTILNWERMEKKKAPLTQHSGEDKEALERWRRER